MRFGQKNLNNFKSWREFPGRASINRMFSTNLYSIRERTSDEFDKGFTTCSDDFARKSSSRLPYETVEATYDMSDNSNVVNVMDRLRTGDQQAASEVFHRFLRRLIGLARTRLDIDLQRKVSPEDIVQSAFMSFFRRQRDGEIDIASWDNLWSLLAVITVHKCGHQIRYYRADRRNAGLEQSAFHFTEDSAAGWEAIAQDPTPSHAVQLTESLRELMHSLDERECHILILSLQGCSAEEIGKEARCSQRTVRRVLEHIRHQLEKQCSPSG